MEVNGSEVQLQVPRQERQVARDRPGRSATGPDRRQCQELPGQELFQYVDDDGIQRDVTSADVNDYLREIAGEEFTAKDFRTWAGTVLAAMALEGFEGFDSKAQAKRNIVRAIESVADRLGNTPASAASATFIRPFLMRISTARCSTRSSNGRTEMTESLGELRPEEAAVGAIAAEVGTGVVVR